MKKLFAITMIMFLALQAKANDIITSGYYVQNNQKVAAIYKNSDIVYIVHHEGMNAVPKTVACDSNKNVYWMVNQYEGTSFRYTEIWKNDQLYVSTQNTSGVRIIDIYCQNDTLYYAGHYTNDDNITVATVWKGTDFTTHWQLGDGTHASFIYDAEVNQNTGIPYFCGYVTEDKTKATIWEKSQIKYSYEPSDYVTGSVAEEISIDNDSVFTLGYYNLDTGFDTYSFSAVWKNGERVASFDAYDVVDCLCASNGDFYYCWAYPHGLEYTVAKNASITIMLRFPLDGTTGANKIKAFSNDIYVLGVNENKGCIWKDFEVFMQPENCDALYDMVEIETNTIPDDYYGLIYQPDSAIVQSVYYNTIYAGFKYNPNGMLDRAYYESYEDYGHGYRCLYDSDLHLIQENDTYYAPMAVPFYNKYTYENDLLKTYARYYDDYHEHNIILQDSVTYFYDALRLLQKAELFRPNSYRKDQNYEYNDREVVITTEGYSNGLTGNWIELNKETRSFSADSLLLTKKTEPYNDSTTLVTYSYDDQGHTLSILTQKRNNGEWENIKTVEFSYNLYGQLTQAEIKQWQDGDFVNTYRAVYELNELGYPTVVTFEKWDNGTWVESVWQDDFYLYNEEHLKKQNKFLYGHRDDIKKLEIVYILTENPFEPLLPDESEWYYEIQNDNGDITYQHLEYAADTTIGNERPKIIVRSNTHYNREEISEVTHEYVYESDGKVYWWNKDLEEFTVLYDLTAQAGDEWEIKVGYESLTMHVDSVDYINYDNQLFRMLHVSDADNLFSGDIVCGVGHLTSFFPERLMTCGKGYRVEGLRCYWVDNELIYKLGDEDCDAIYDEWHHGLDEQTDNAAFVVYPNPANNVLFVETCHGASLPAPTYRITNLMGQTLLHGNINAENQRIDISMLPAGMYFITVGKTTQKFVVRR